MVGEVIDRAEALFRSGQAQQAMSLLGTAARNNDADALEYLARMSVAGTLVHRDLQLARDLFRRAAAAGSVTGSAAYRAFVANGTGGPANWAEAVRLLSMAAPNDPDAQRELEVIRAMPLSNDGDPVDDFKLERISDSPDVIMLKSIFSEAECDFLIETARPGLEPSTVIDPYTGQHVPNPVRTSEAIGFPLVAESPVIHALCKRLAAASGTGVKQGEPLQVLRYLPGQEYRPHFDSIEHADNQRILTFLVYLNEEYEGGETEFLTGGLKVKGRKGDGLLFRNADAAGRPDPNAQHAGLPVTAGEKYLASRWIREKRFTPE